MSTTLSPTESLATLRERFQAITQEQERLSLERRRVLVEERDRWRADGIDAHIVGQPASAKKLERRHLVSMFEVIRDGKRDVSYRKIYVGDDPNPEWGPYAGSTCIWIHRGAYVCVLADDEAVVIVAATKVHPISANQVARAATRLRSLARREHMRVSIRDTAATLKSPMNDVVHEGDIASSYLWLCGIDESTIEDRTRAYWESAKSLIPQGAAA